MDYKLLVMDLDGTIVGENNSVSEETIKTIARLKKMGLQVIVATGRMLCSALPIINKLGLTGPMITYNGAYIKDTYHNTVLYHKTIDLELAREILEEAEEKDLHINLYIDDRLYVAREDELSRLYEKTSGIRAHAVGSLSSFMSKAPTKLLIITRDIERHDYFLRYFQEKYQDLLEITMSKYEFIEFMPAGTSKALALKVVSSNLGIGLSEVVAIGDSWNDLSMIKEAGLGIVMGTAPEGVKKEADMIAPSYDEEGVSVILKNIFESG
ncbi:MAG TPA: Cof-type HAD-IIB family hydrolase [Halanaerobiales bacterium]|nr:Cof-type HAD-IIB family hydrolase [Halanaerobiales bacterium]